VKASKCEFNKPEVQFLGHVVGAEGVKVDPFKTAAVNAYPRPTNVKELRTFMGLASYFRKFLKKFCAPHGTTNQAARRKAGVRHRNRPFSGSRPR
jgi:hypothetical protein